MDKIICERKFGKTTKRGVKTMITNEQKEYLETAFDCYIDIETLEYNYHSHDSVFGWEEIPEDWLDEINYFD